MYYRNKSMLQDMIAFLYSSELGLYYTIRKEMSHYMQLGMSRIDSRYIGQIFVGGEEIVVNTV